VWVVVVGKFIQQFGTEKTAVQGKKIVAQAGKACTSISGFELSQGGELFLV